MADGSPPEREGRRRFPLGHEESGAEERAQTGLKAKTLHMIGNAHLDPVWLWQWQEGFQEAKSTFRSVLNLMRESDEGQSAETGPFLFTSSSAALYEWVEQNDPAMFQEIKQRVAEGRWEIVGGWWIQPDCNLPSGESFARQALYGQRFFAEKLGVTATVGYNVDSFGHAASLPQILRKSGLTSYVFTRPHPHEQRLPSRLFWWESDDGSRVLAFRIPYEYNTWGKGVQQQVQRCAAELKGALGELMCFYGVGNHGGGPTRDNLESIREMNLDPSYPTLRFSTPSRYFEATGDRAVYAPVVHDELQHHASGCYSAHSGVKRWNRQAEGMLITAEKFCALAMRVTGLPYPVDFERAWKDTLFNQFHDILAGTSIEPAYDDARNLYGEAMAIAARNLNGAIQSLSWNINIEYEEGARPVAVFNPHSWTARAEVELEFGPLAANDVLLDAEGRQVPFQNVRPLASVSGGRNRLSFLAEVPALGYQVYRVTPGAASLDVAAMHADDTFMENDYFRLEINPETGCLRSLYDKRDEFEWLRDEAACALVLKDESDTWSHGVLRYDAVVGRFTPRSVKLAEHGPVKSVIRVEGEYDSSRLRQDFTLYRELDQIDVHVTVDWREQFKLLKLRFPLNLYYTSATYEIPYGSIQRPANGEEEPGQSWVDLTGIGLNNGNRLGMSLLNDGKYSFDLKEHEINLTVLRSPIYAHHIPYQPQADASTLWARYSFIDQGVQSFTYTLLPHRGSWEDAGTVQRAAELNGRLIAQVESFHPGPLPKKDSYLAVDRPSVMVTAIKRAEDGDDLIVRCFETSGIRTEATILLPHWNRAIEAIFNAGEIKTFRVAADPSHPVRETNLVEWEE